MKLSGTGVLAVAGLAVLGVAAWKLFPSLKELVTHDLNPASEDNVVNRGVEALGRSITGDQYWTLGGSIYDATHTDPHDPSKNTAIAAVNPADEGNLINRGVNAIGRSVSGNGSWTLGGWIYDFTH